MYRVDGIEEGDSDMKILVADDDAVTRRLLQAQLTKWGYSVVVCSDGSSAWDCLRDKDTPKLIILDWMMPGMSGVSLCRKIRELEQERYIYTILLTARTRKEDILEGLEAGADDYVTKPFDPNELKVRVRAGARIVQLHEDLKDALRSLEHQASHDVLTGLWNRGAIMDILHNEWIRSDRNRRAIGLILTDVDHFKRINDQFGHLAGDAVLRSVAARIAATVRPYDFVGRYGGEEFLIVLPDCDTEGASQVARRLRSEFSDNPITTPEGVFNVTMSFGVASVTAGRSIQEEDVVRAADEALYRAKDGGRNRVEIWEGMTRWNQSEKSRPRTSSAIFDQAWQMPA